MKRLSERYSVAERIGRGGVGDVYKGWQEALDRPVAIKVLRPEFTRSAQAMRRFEREARTTSRLRHPNVVTVFDVGLADDGTRFLVMELLEGTPLAKLLAEQAPLPIEDALAIARQIVRGMSAGEGVGLVHRDLKPENIFLERDLHVKILDFGLATLLDTRGDAELDESAIARAEPPEVGDAVDSRQTFSLDGEESKNEARPPAATQAHAVMGTPRYMPPEQVLGWGIDHRSDLYAFGCILFEMLAGRPPFPGPESADYMRQHLHGTPASLAALRPEVSGGLLAIVERLLEKAPAARFQDWPSLDAALENETEASEEKRGVLLAATPSGESDPLPTEPYRFLQPFSAASQAIFFGRERDVERFRAAWDHVDRPRILFVTGASGVGKTSFLLAKVVPTLEHLGNRVLVVRGGFESARGPRAEARREGKARGVAGRGAHGGRPRSGRGVVHERERHRPGVLPIRHRRNRRGQRRARAVRARRTRGLPRCAPPHAPAATARRARADGPAPATRGGRHQEGARRTGPTRRRGALPPLPLRAGGARRHRARSARPMPRARSRRACKPSAADSGRW